MTVDWEALREAGLEPDMANARDVEGKTLEDHLRDVRQKWRQHRRILLEMGVSAVTYAYQREIFRYWARRKTELWGPATIPLVKRG